MSLSRSPSPARGGGWSSPGLSTPTSGMSRGPSPIRHIGPRRVRAQDAPWTSVSRVEPRSFASATPQQGGFTTSLRKISASLPFWRPRNYSDKEKLGRGRMANNKAEWKRGDRILPFIGRMLWRMRLQILLGTVCMAMLLLATGPLIRSWRHAGFLGGGNKFVLLLATNLGGGVMEWKGPREWAIERDSIENKRKYIKRWGYALEKVDLSTKKRYAHEWRESWEKVDMIKKAMHKYPDAEWFWWLDLHTFIMEPTYSLQSHVFRNLNNNVYRDINVYNPLNISHPLTDHYLDAVSLSPIGDGRADSINLIIPQDCGGFNLGSFFIRRSAWTDRLLDIWWDPVGYEQKHMDWEHKEQDALEWLYKHQPWVRSHVAFIPQRRINSFPPGACGDLGINSKIHYSADDRDFVVNMAGCEWGRDCWGEMFEYRRLSERLNRGMLGRLAYWFKQKFVSITHVDLQQQQQQQQQQQGPPAHAKAKKA